MRNWMIILVSATISSTIALAEERAISSAEALKPFEIASYEYSARSFFEPKTEADVNALVSLDQDLERSLKQEELN